MSHVSMCEAPPESQIMIVDLAGLARLRLQALGIQVFDSNEVDSLSVYIDGADEIDGQGYMVKGGGAVLVLLRAV